MSKIQQILSEDHAELERQLKTLADAVHANDSSADLRRVWGRFESNLLEHLKLEERQAFPPVAASHRVEIEALRAEHREIRRRVAELGICVELHALREGAVLELIELLRAHAERETRSLYTWLDEPSAGPAWRQLYEMFERHRQREPDVSSERSAASNGTSK